MKRIFCIGLMITYLFLNGYAQYVQPVTMDLYTPASYDKFVGGEYALSMTGNISASGGSVNLNMPTQQISSLIAYDKLTFKVYLDNSPNIISMKLSLNSTRYSYASGNQTERLDVIEIDQKNQWVQYELILDYQQNPNIRQQLLHGLYGATLSISASGADATFTGGNTSGFFTLYVRDFKLSEPNNVFPYDNSRSSLIMPSWSRPLNNVIDWIEGEDTNASGAKVNKLLGTNFIEGPNESMWHFDALTHGRGVNDLAASQLPDWKTGDPDDARRDNGKAAYYAIYRMNLDGAGTYSAFFYGRIPGYYASGLKWQIDSGDIFQISPNEAVLLHYNGLLSGERNDYRKYGVIYLGKFTISDNNTAHTITIYVDDYIPNGHDYNMFHQNNITFAKAGYCQQIDALSIHKCDYTNGYTPSTSDHPSMSVRINSGSNVRSLPTPSNSSSSSNQTITSGSLSLTLADNGGIRQIRIGNTNLINNTSTPAFLTVRYKDNTATTFDAVSIIPQDGTIVLTGTKDNISVNAVFTPDADKNQIRIDTEVTNSRTGGTSDKNIDCVLLAPLTGLQFTDANSNYLMGIDTRTAASLNYAASAPMFKMDFVAAYNNARCFYFYYEDDKPIDSSLEANRSGSNVTMRLAKYPKISQNGGVYISPTLVFGAYNEGDWHKAGDYYHDWWYSWAKTPNYTKWFKSIGAMIHLGDIYTSQNQNDIIEQFKYVRDKLGIPYIYSGGWLPYYTEAWYPDSYYASWQDPVAFNMLKTFTERLRAENGRFTGYTNAIMISRMTDYFWNHQNYSVTNYDGTHSLTEHQTRHHPMVKPCAGTKWTEDFYNSLKGMIEPYDNNGTSIMDVLYVDQIGAVQTFLCYDETHEHNHEGGIGYGSFVYNYVNLVKYIHEQAAASGKTGENTLLTFIERPQPHTNQYAAYSFIGSNDVYKYIFPTYTSARGEYSATTLEQFHNSLNNAFLANDIHVSIYQTALYMDASMNARYRSIMEFKKKVSPVIWDARFRDTIGLTATGGIQSRIFSEKDAVYITVIGAPNRGSVTVDLSKHFGEDYFVDRATIWTDTSAPVQVTPMIQGNNVTVNIPAGTNAALITVCALPAKMSTPLVADKLLYNINKKQKDDLNKAVELSQSNLWALVEKL